MRPWEKPDHSWIPASFLVFAFLLADLSLERGGPHLVLLWPATNCAAVALAYRFRRGERVFGKRADGAMGGAAAVALLPFRLVIWSVWRVQVALSPERCWDEPGPGLFLGRRPLRGEYPPGIALVVDLTCELPKPRHHPPGVRYLCLPSLDAYVPDAAAFAQALDAAAAVPAVYVHCANGHGRSAAFAAALLLRRGLARDLDEAMTIIRRARPACRLTPAQAGLAASSIPRGHFRRDIL